MNNLINEIKLKHKDNSKLEELFNGSTEKQFEHFYDYLQLADSIADEGVLNDKDIARKIYIELEKIASDFDEYINLADSIADVELLNDKKWAKKIYIELENLAKDFEDYKDLARSISVVNGLKDKVWAKILFIKAIEEEKKINDEYLFTLINLTGLIVSTLYLDDKEFAIEIYKDIEKRLKYKEECITLAYEISFKLKNKEWAKELFSKRSNFPDFGMKWPQSVLTLERRLEKL